MSSICRVDRILVPMGWVDTDALVMASTPGKQGGPGFERAVLEDMLRGWTTKDVLYLTREATTGINSDGSGSHEWRFWDKTGKCIGLRYTPL